METYTAILGRRSIRKFLDRDIPVETIEKILNAAIQAPSAKNQQPWKFVVVAGDAKTAMLEAMRAGIENEKKGDGLFPGSPAIPWAEHTLHVMAQAPVTVFVFNMQGSPFWDQNGQSKPMDIADIVYIQSVSAAIENMLLCATDMDIGSLWIADIFFAYRELCEWLNEDHQLIAAVSFGYPDENPDARPRKALADVVEWR